MSSIENIDTLTMRGAGQQAQHQPQRAPPLGQKPRRTLRSDQRRSGRSNTAQRRGRRFTMAAPPRAPRVAYARPVPRAALLCHTPVADPIHTTPTPPIDSVVRSWRRSSTPGRCLPRRAELLHLHDLASQLARARGEPAARRPERRVSTCSSTPCYADSRPVNQGPSNPGEFRINGVAQVD